ncbi:hypothetical protein EYF80_057195 [Liparis tanakae]|uniref:Uncharacterized protein n=1 Tax=Liparis tanakae TaxID=230148 RepID=A0A4Z2EV27_9TELE|nr:hypothetical protein EYF80_057195 [Liparis tanakae]
MANAQMPKLPRDQNGGAAEPARPDGSWSRDPPDRGPMRRSRGVTFAQDNCILRREPEGVCERRRHVSRRQPMETGGFFGSYASLLGQSQRGGGQSECVAASGGLANEGRESGVWYPTMERGGVAGKSASNRKKRERRRRKERQHVFICLPVRSDFDPDGVQKFLVLA